MECLSPRLDIVFKLLFVKDETQELIISLLNCILKPETPIKSVTITNPELPKADVDDRGVYLDILVIHEDGSKTDVEMQVEDYKNTEQRALYHWGRMYGDSITRGQEYKKLVPCRVIFIMDYELHKTEGLHSVYQMLARENYAVLSEHVEIHTIELPKLRRIAVEGDKPLLDWARFLKSSSNEEREQVAVGSSVIKKANEALKSLSEDPEVRRIARAREHAIFLHHLNYQSVVDHAVAEQKKLSEQVLEEQKALSEQVLEEQKALSEQALAEQKALLEEQQMLALEEQQAAERKTQVCLLTRMINKRFGELSPEQTQLLASASIDTLNSWTECLLDVDDLEQLLGN